jgi:hypothetical protein
MCVDALTFDLVFFLIVIVPLPLVIADMGRTWNFGNIPILRIRRDKLINFFPHKKRSFIHLSLGIIRQTGIHHHWSGHYWSVILEELSSVWVPLPCLKMMMCRPVWLTPWKIFGTSWEENGSPIYNYCSAGLTGKNKLWWAWEHPIRQDYCRNCAYASVC